MTAPRGTAVGRGALLALAAALLGAALLTWPPDGADALPVLGRAPEGGLDPALDEALRLATAAAAREGVDVRVNSGRRSAREQEQLLDEAVARYGSEREAARWVARPEDSAHVSGDAVDVGPWRASAWLGEHGAAYGLCQVYDNEPWHFELRPDAVHDGCPPRYADPTQDPRTRGWTSVNQG